MTGLLLRMQCTTEDVRVGLEVTFWDAIPSTPTAISHSFPAPSEPKLVICSRTCRTDTSTCTPDCRLKVMAAAVAPTQTTPTGGNLSSAPAVPDDPDNVTHPKTPTLSSFVMKATGDQELAILMQAIQLSCKAITRAVRKAGEEHQGGVSQQSVSMED